MWTIAVDTAKIAIYARIRFSSPGPGYCQFPTSYNEVFFHELTAEKVHTKCITGFAGASGAIKLDDELGPSSGTR